MLRVGLTGGIASGKSTVAEMFRDLGVQVIDSDIITHELLTPGASVYHAVVAEFGPEVVAPDGRIDRRLLGAIVFEDPERRHALERLVHPGVAERQDQFLDEVAARDPNAIGIVDAALMIETGSHQKYDRIVVVSCTPRQQRERLGDRGLGSDAIDARINAQMPLVEKCEYADYVIDNSGTLEETRRQVEMVWKELTTLAGD